MIAGIVVYLLAVSAVLACAAWAVSEGLRKVGLPGRWVWLAALAGGPALLVASLAPQGSPAARLAPAQVVRLEPLLAAMTDVGASTSLDAWAGGVWLVFSAVFAAWVARTHVRLRREREGWARVPVRGREVYVSPDRGPAVSGVVRPWIVLPGWALGLPEAELDLVILHEEEHLRGRDSRLLAAALVLVLAAPWNPVSWWMLRRLRVAVEIDCDRRVLRRAPDRARYGHSLLSVAGRSRGPSLGLAAFTEGPRALERRIVAMTEARTRWTPLSAGLLTLLGLVVAVQACSVESPVVEAERVEAQASTRSSEPSFTPFTVAPAILNRSEVIEAMEREYPPLLREAGVGGTVAVYFFITDAGEVALVRIDESSGHPALDEAALRVGRTFRFSPALDGTEPVGVWAKFPITFQVS